MIDRKALIQRHNPHYTKADLMAPLSVGNGRFCFTADITGLQSMREYVRCPLCTMAGWAWHSYPNAPKNEDDFRLTQYDTWGRLVGYADSAEGQEELYDALRENAHRANLARIGFAGLELANIEDTEQKLDMWNGILTSTFIYTGQATTVETLVHPEEDTVFASVTSKAGLPLQITLPYPTHFKDGGDFDREDAHTTIIEQETENCILLKHTMDELTVFVRVAYKNLQPQFDNLHTLTLTPTAENYDFSVHFANEKPNMKTDLYKNARTLAINFWQGYWEEGGAIDLHKSKDKRALELERRLVLSQYLIAIQSRDDIPPAETGLTCNSWYGKFHMEMHYWHCTHFALWGRIKELKKSLAYYKKILPIARDIAKKQGYSGARWPKMCDATGYSNPSPIAVLLVWQQPHPILLAELCWRVEEDESFLREYLEVVLESAEFMADFAHFDGSRYVLGAPLIPAQEYHDPREVLNPGYEVEYFRWALLKINEWLERLGEPPNPRFAKIAEGLAPPAIYEGVYPAHENCPNTFTQTPFFTDHPSMTAMLGMLPGERVDKEVMHATLDRVLKDWDMPSLWGWDFPMMAMTAAKLGLPDKAVDLMLMNTPKNTYLANGHNTQVIRDDLPLYLPGNGGILLAAALMAAGWDADDNTHAPGFPQNGSFVVEFEGIAKYI